MIKTKDEFMRTFLGVAEYRWWQRDVKTKNKSAGIWEDIAIGRKKEYNKANNKAFRIKVSSKIWRW